MKFYQVVKTKYEQENDGPNSRTFRREIEQWNFLDETQARKFLGIKEAENLPIGKNFEGNSIYYGFKLNTGQIKFEDEGK